MILTEKHGYDCWRQVILSRITALMAMLVAFLEIWRLTCFSNIDGFNTIMVFYYTVCLIPVPVFLRSRHFTVSATLMLFCIMCAVSLIFNDPIKNYISTLRLGLFVVMLSLVSPLVTNEPLRDFRRRLCNYTLLLMQIAVALSIVGYFVTLIATGKGNVILFIGHYILLGILSSFVSIVVTCRLLGRENRSPWYIAADIVLLAICILLMIWSGTRSAMIGFAIAQIYVLSYYYRRRKITKWIIAGIFAAIVATVSIGGIVTYKVSRKFSFNIENKSIFFSREDKWDALTREFARSPLIGIGFGNVEMSAKEDGIEIVENFGASYSKAEPGSSWLSVLSNTGIAGFVIMAYWNIKLLMTVWRRRRLGDNAAVCSSALLLVMLTVGFFEGYILYAGSILFFLYWLLTSQIYETNPQINEANPQINKANPQINEANLLNNKTNPHTGNSPHIA